MILQPSVVSQTEYSVAFTLSHLENLRVQATNLGDQLMRVLLVSVPINTQPVRCNIHKLEAKKVMPKVQVQGGWGGGEGGRGEGGGGGGEGRREGA